MPVKFGTDGWRAVIGEEFTFDNVRKVAFAHAKVLERQGKTKVIVGYDHRFMSEKFAQEVCSVFRQMGFDAYMTNRACTTPMVSFAVKYMNFDNGVMITASHNPPEYNGYKIKDSFGGSATTEFVKEVEKEFERVKDVKIQSVRVEYINVWGEYIRKVKELINQELLNEGEMLLVHDAMYGSSVNTYAQTLAGTKISVLPTRAYRDPLFGGHAPEPVEKNLMPLMEKVRAVHASLGIANDGDGDRIALVDEKGKFVNSQMVYVLLLYHLLKNKGIRDGIVVKTVSTTYLADRICKEEGIQLKEVAVGFKNINEVILKEKVLFGGEESGGYGIVSFLPERDGLFSGLSILELLQISGKTPSEMVQEIFKRYGSAYYKRQDIYAQEDKKKKLFELINHPPEKLLSYKVREINTTDGLKLIFENDGWILFRASGTEPLIRIYAEMPKEEETERILEEGIKLLG